MLTSGHTRAKGHRSEHLKVGTSPAGGVAVIRTIGGEVEPRVPAAHERTGHWRLSALPYVSMVGGSRALWPITIHKARLGLTPRNNSNGTAPLFPYSHRRGGGFGFCGSEFGAMACPSSP